MATCTWENCKADAAHPQLGRDGVMWANLCPAHHKEMDDSVGDVKGMLRNWIKAQGGPKGAADRMRRDGAIEKAQRLMARRRR